MAEEKIPKITLKWMPKQKRARGRPKKNWMEGIKLTDRITIDFKRRKKKDYF